MMMFAKATATNFYGLDEFHFGFYDAATGEFEDCLKEGRTLRGMSEIL